MMRNLRAVDLNLLVILDALLREGSVSAAAERIPLSQPATSLALKRLRMLLDDPLLVRSGARMSLTSKAESLRQPLAAILRDIAHTLAPEEFDPAASRRVFRIVCTDHAELALLPELLRDLGKNAPGAQLVSLPIDGQSLKSEAVRAGEVDLVIGFLPSAPEGFHSRALFRERFVCIARKKHPAFRQGLTLDAFTAARHVLASPQGGSLSGPVDEALARLRRERFVAVSVPRFAVIPALVAGSDLVATLPARIAERREWARLVDVHELPLKVPGFEVRMLWHPRHHHSPGHRWFRHRVAECIGS